MNRWAKVKAYLRLRGVYSRHVLQLERLPQFGNQTATQYGKKVGYPQILRIFRGLYG